MDYDDNSVVNMFDIILDETFSDTEYTGIDDERYYKNLLRTNRRVSKRYVRPIFKEPGSKSSQKSYETFNDNQQYGSIPLNWKRAIENLPNIVSPSYQTQTESSTLNNDDVDHFRPSTYQSRLEYIVGNPIERHKFNNRDNPVTLRSRFLQRQNWVNSSTDTESTIAAMGDIDILETKKLRPSSTADGGDLSLLRQEINRIVSSNLDARDPEGSKRSSKRLNDFDDEEREGYEGCASHGCVGVRTELQDLINDMKEFFVQDNWKNVSV